MNCRCVRIEYVAEILQNDVFISVGDGCKQKLEARSCSSPSSDGEETWDIFDV